MPPRPFPFALNVGTDIVHIPRIQSIMTKDGADTAGANTHRFLRRVLSSREQSIFWKRFGDRNGVQSPELNAATEYLAGRWAAKEAVIKAVQHRRLSFLDIEILPSRREGRAGPPYALILDEPASASHVGPDAEVTGKTGHESDVQDLDDDSDERGSLHGIQADKDDGQVAKISISHDGEYATAVCIAAEEPRAGDVGGEAAAREP